MSTGEPEMDVGDPPDAEAPVMEVDEGADLSWVEGMDRPKVVEWEELQQELARLMSLHSELMKAKEMKEELSRRLEPLIEVRRQSLQQSNELEEMKQKLEARKRVMGDKSIRTKRTLEDLSKKREMFRFEVGQLLVAAEKLSSAHQQLQETGRLLAGEKGLGHLKLLQKMQRVRQQYMISQVAALYPVKPLTEQTSDEKLDSSSSYSKTNCKLELIKMEHIQGNSSPTSSPKSPLTILGQQLTMLPGKSLGFFTDKKEVQRSATVLGYVAHAVSLIGSYLNVPLRYPPRFGGSRSYILDYAPSTESTSSDMALNPIGSRTKPAQFPLFLDGQDTTRAAYAIFLLNKDLEQILNYTGADSLGPRHLLANMREIIRIVQSSEFIDAE